MAVDFKHPDYINMLPRWTLAERVCDVKDLDKYLRELEPSTPDSDKDKIARNKEYKDGAAFYPTVQNAVKNISASAFKKNPHTELPTSLEYILENCDGAGNALFQQARRSFGECLKKARGGLWVDVPAGGGDAYIYLAEAEQIINWKTTVIDGKRLLSLVVIHEIVHKYTDEYSFTNEDQWLVLYLDDDGYYAAKRVTKGKDAEEKEELFTPTGGSGERMSEIPFYFFGELNNDEIVDFPAIYPVADLNTKHYRNSADFEDSAFYAGNPIIYAQEGLTQNQMDLMQKNHIMITSKRAMPFPMGIAQAGESTMSRLGMQDKMQAMASMLASLVGIQQKTATEVNSEDEKQTNTLVMIARNVSAAYVRALETAQSMNNQAGDIVFEINDVFIRPVADAQMLTAVVAGWMQGAISQRALFKYLKEHGVEHEDATFEEYQEEVETQASVPDLEQGFNG